jgi:cutinase
MKFLFAITALSTLAAALPAPAGTVSVEEILSWKTLIASSAEQPQKRGVNTRNELQEGGTCPPVIFIYARGSTENGNLVCLRSTRPVPQSPSD